MGFGIHKWAVKRSNREKNPVGCECLAELYWFRLQQRVRKVTSSLNKHMTFMKDSKFIPFIPLDHLPKLWWPIIWGAFSTSHLTWRSMIANVPWWKSFMTWWCDWWLLEHAVGKKVPPPRKLTWNRKMMVVRRNLLFQGFIFSFHVRFRGVYSPKVSGT